MSIRGDRESIITHVVILRAQIFYNINGLFEQNQDGLKYYGTEVLCCQFGIYLQIRNDEIACENRKVSRSSVFGESGNLERFM